MRTMNSREKRCLSSEQKIERDKLYDKYMKHYSQKASKWFLMEPYYFKYQRMLGERIQKCEENVNYGIKNKSTVGM